MASTSSSTTGTHVLGQQQLEQHLQQLVALDHPNVLQTYCAVTYAQDGAAAAGPTTQHTSHEFDYGPKACAGSKSSRDQHSPQQQQQQQPGMSPSTCADLETWLVQVSITHQCCGLTEPT
jgi:hypothetical protein